MKKKYVLVGIGIFFIGLLAVIAFFLKTILWGKLVPFPEDACSQPASCNVKEIKFIGEGTHPKWSETNNLIVFDKMVHGIYEIFTMRPDGSSVTCLTCNKKDAPQGHKGQAYWHPSGEYLVFAAENEYGKQRSSNTPGIGRDNEVWIMSADGNKYWRITNHPEKWGVIRPSFSHDGTKLYWNEEYSCEGGKYGCSFWNHWNLFFRKGEEVGVFRVKLSDISFKSGEPVISNIKNIDHEGLRLLEGAGFTPDDTRLVYSYSDTSKTNGQMFWGDIYTSSPDGSNLRQITNTQWLHEENPEFSPDGKKLVTMSGSYVNFFYFYRTELYLMDADGSNKMRLTYFNKDPKDIHLSGESSWSPNGSQIIFHKYDKSAKEYSAGKLFMLTFEGPCGKL